MIYTLMASSVGATDAVTVTKIQGKNPLVLGVRVLLSVSSAATVKAEPIFTAPVTELTLFPLT